MSDIKEVFIKFAQVGCPGATEMTGKNFTKLCKDSGILDKKVTTTDLDIEFSKKIPKGKKMSFKNFEAVIQILAAKKGVEADILYGKIKAAQPGMTGTTKALKVGGVERMTDTSLYTGAHKERFNSDGTGRGLEGRNNSVDDSGYVGGYKGAGTYDKKMSK